MIEASEKRFMNFVRDKIHVLEEESVRLYPSLNMQNHLKMYKPSFFAVNYIMPVGPTLERFSKI